MKKSKDTQVWLEAAKTQETTTKPESNIRLSQSWLSIEINGLKIAEKINQNKVR